MTDTSTPSSSSATTSSTTPFVWPISFIGDDWQFPYTYENPDGSAINLTDAQPQAKLFAKNQLAAVFSMSGSTGVTVVDAVNGKVVFEVPKTLTSTLAADGCSEGYPTRIAVQLIDTAGNLKTYRVDGVPVDDPRFVPIG